MVVFVKQKSSKNEGFSLLEVMVTGIILMVFVILSSSIIDQGVEELQQRKQMIRIANHIDAWTAEIKKNSFSSESLSLGSHQKEIHDSSQMTYQLHWYVEELAPGFKGISFEVRNSANGKILHEWRTGMLLQW